MTLIQSQKKKIIEQLNQHLLGDDRSDIQVNATLPFKSTMAGGIEVTILPSSIDFVFNVNGQEIHRISECNCSTCIRTPIMTPDLKDINIAYHSKQPTGLHRRRIETAIVDYIIKNNKICEKINLVCVGNDWLGLSIILAKLYKKNYRHFSIINITLARESELSLQKKNNQKNLDFWRELFDYTQIECQTLAVGVDVNDIDLSSLSSQLENAKVMVFAEDLSSQNENDTVYKVTYHNTSVSNIVNELVNVINAEKISFIDFYGDIGELRARQKLLVNEYGQFEISAKRYLDNIDTHVDNGKTTKIHTLAQNVASSSRANPLFFSTTHVGSGIIKDSAEDEHVARRLQEEFDRESIQIAKDRELALRLS